MPQLEVRQWQFLRWRYERGELGGPNDGCELVLSGARLLDADTEKRLLRRIMKRVRDDVHN